MPGIVLSAEDITGNKKGHGIHSHDVYVLFEERGNKASTQLLIFTYLFLIGGTLYDSKYKKVHSEKPPTPAPSHLVPSIEASNVISFFCTHPEITYEYTSKYILPAHPPALLYRWWYSIHSALHLGIFFT